MIDMVAVVTVSEQKELQLKAVLICTTKNTHFQEKMRKKLKPPDGDKWKRF